MSLRPMPAPSTYEPRFDLTPDEIAAHTAETIAYLVETNDAIASVPLDDVTFENTARKLIDLESYLTMRASNLVILLQTSPLDSIRGACGMALQQVMGVSAQQNMRVDTYKVMKRLASNAEAMAACSPEHRRYVERGVEASERSGLQLDDVTRQQVGKLDEKISTLELQFNQNLSEELIELRFSADELDGLSDDFVANLPKGGDDQFTVVLSYPTVFPILNTCVVPETRKRVEIAFNSRCIDKNTAVLAELVALRHERAVLLGYANHASYVLYRCMAKSPDAVRTFLTQLNDKLTPLADQEMATLLALKKEECDARGLVFDGQLNVWDTRYYMDQYVKKHCSIDAEKVREYFPLEHVTKELLAMYQELLSLKFVEIEEPHVWHSGVRKFAVHDARPGRNDRLMGHFYMDMFPRPGKFTHAGCMDLQPSSVDSTGERTLPSTALLTNFPRPTDARPSLLKHSEVETFFHEFGHVMHTVCSETTTAMFAGTRVEKDFVEAPSQMLENWCWYAAPLQRLSSHYVTREPLSDELTTQLLATRNANKALHTKRSIMLALFDQAIHAGETVDTTALFAQLHNDVLGVPVTPGTNFVASFGHLASGYDAQYYGYLWSEVFSMDMFQSRFKKEGLMNPTTGAAYRDLILTRGGSVDASDMLKEFLGREPNQNAFLESNGLAADAKAAL